ncbi:MAG: sensor histidine kinase [Terriglobales bacterium]
MLSGREGVLLLLGILFFPVIVAGLVLNTIFLVREIRRNEQHNAFINAVTHELKTPLASIRLYLETLQAREVAPEQRLEFYRTMLSDSDRLLATVEQILRTGRAAHAPRRVAQQRLDLAALARAEAAHVAARYDLPAEAMVCSGLPPEGEAAVNGDAGELSAALSNLFDNAVKYSGERPRVSWDLAARESAWVLRVSDQGTGIPRSELKSIFKRFYRIPNQSLQVSGTGLGLFIVRSVVRRHGGRIHAESAGAGRGSTFVLRVPQAPSASVLPQITAGRARA